MASIPDAESHYTDALRAQAQEMKKERGLPTLGFYGELMVYPGLFEKVQALGTFLRFESALPPRMREAAILMVAVELRSPFEWQTHHATSAAAGVDDALREAIAGQGKLSQDLEDVRSCVRAVVRQESVPQELFDRLTASLGLQQAVELVVLAASYRMNASLAAAFDSVLPGAPPAPF